LLVQQTAKSSEPSKEQANDGVLAALHVAGDLGQRLALQVMEFDCPALIRGKLSQCVGQAEQLFLAHQVFIGGGRCGRGSGLPSCVHVSKAGLQGPLSGDVARTCLELSRCHGQGILQYRTQPRSELCFGVTPELVQFLMGLKQRLLNHVGRVEFPLQARAQEATGTQVKKYAVPFQILGSNSLLPDHIRLFSDRRAFRHPWRGFAQ
jgi:hypothetical protein